MTTHPRLPLDVSNTPADLLQEIQRVGLQSAVESGLQLSAKASRDEKDGLLGALLLGAWIDPEATTNDVANTANQFMNG